VATLFFGFEEWTFESEALDGPADGQDADTEQAEALRDLLATTVTPLPTSGWRALHVSPLAATFAAGQLATGLTVAWLEWFQPSFLQHGGDDRPPRDDSGRWLPRGTYEPITSFRVAPPAGTTRCTWWLRTQPAATDREIAVYATDPTCASGQPTGDRLRPPLIETNDREVRIAFAATRLAGDHTCPSHPPTPRQVVLDEPIGERTLLDGGAWPAQPPPSGPDH
jgi:hypothetical protein